VALLLVPKQAGESVDTQLPPLVYVCMMGIGGAKIITLHAISYIAQINISYSCKGIYTGPYPVK
jgi:hypothetical protein